MNVGVGFVIPCRKRRCNPGYAILPILDMKWIEGLEYTYVVATRVVSEIISLIQDILLESVLPLKQWASISLRQENMIKINLKEEVSQWSKARLLSELFRRFK